MKLGNFRWFFDGNVNLRIVYSWTITNLFLSIRPTFAVVEPLPVLNGIPDPSIRSSGFSFQFSVITLFLTDSTYLHILRFTMYLFYSENL
jgi:hypothetical protein